MMKVIKFGGTSLGTSNRIKEVAKLIQNENAIIVLSAVSGTTNKLTEIANLLYQNNKKYAKIEIKELEDFYYTLCENLFTKKEYLESSKNLIQTHFKYIDSFTEDLFTNHEEKAILAQGELISTALFQSYLEEINIESSLISALDFMRIDKDLEPDEFYIKHNLERELKQLNSKLYITQGYICRNVFGEIDNLKRGGSDYTASLIGTAILASEIEIWTDIDGMHNNDPRIVENTFSIQNLSYDEAAELAYFGAKILHPASVFPAKQKNIPIFLKNTLEPSKVGTKIDSSASEREFTAVAAKDSITAIKIKSGRMLLAYGFLRKIFEIFERYKTPIDVITTSEVAVSLTIDDSTYLKNIKLELENLGEVETNENQTIICIVGNFAGNKIGTGNKIFDCFKNIPIRMISYGGSQHNVSVVVEESRKKEALLALNKGLF